METNGICWDKLGVNLMTKIITSEDCGNSPKNIFVQALTIAFTKADLKFIQKSVTDNVRWAVVGEKTIEGKDILLQAVEQAADVEELIVLHVMTHGKAGAVNGKKRLKNGMVLEFCNVYEFKDAKGTSVQAITTYEIKIN